MLQDRDRRGYPAYKDLRGSYEFGDFVLSIDHVQGDPFASPTKASAFMAHEDACFPPEWLGIDGRDDADGDAGLMDSAPARRRRRALEDFIVRRLGCELGRRNSRGAGSGKSGLLSTSRPGPEVLERTACEIAPDGIIVRLEVGLPAHGRSIDGHAAERVLCELVPAAIRATLSFRDYDGRSARAAREAVELSDDQLFVRGELARRGLVAFVAEGSILPRASGVSQQPLRGALPFVSPESLRVTLDLPHRGPTSGMGIARGVTLIVGGGYHGKSTLLQALQDGVYDHVAGDGRELAITEDTACKLRAEDGRAVHDVDVSAFIGELPNGLDTRRFSTDDASGSTSQAASLVEDVEAGCGTLLIDEDTSATNFMVRDALMEQVVNRSHEPITPFIERARDLWERAGVSSVIVAGSSGAYFHVADTVIQMDCYRALDVTGRVREVLAALAVAGETGVERAGGFVLPNAARMLAPAGSGNGTAHGRGAHGGRGDRDGGRGDRGHRGEGRLKVRTHGLEALEVGGISCDVRLVEQIVDPEQVAALAQMARHCLEQGLLHGHTIEEAVDELRGQVRHDGLAAFGPASYTACGLAMPRVQEVYACLNRLRGL